VRAPANISLLALLLLWLMRSPKICWAKYAGDWTRRGGEPLSYRFQRWWLFHGLHRGLVTVNGRSPNQPPHVHSFLNPCLAQAELEQGVTASQEKRLSQPVRLLFVGRIESAKGADLCLEILAQLEQGGILAQLDLIGEGEELAKFEQKARDLGVFPRVKFQGGLPRDTLGQFYGRAHFILLPSDSEGWPKVLSEAMAYGVVPIASAVGSIPEYLANFTTGTAINSRDPRLYSAAVESYLRAPARWNEHSRNAVKGARQFSYADYLRAVARLLELPAVVESAPA
jgi:glycosyltransferase involved in cell wall biosynthesis